MLERTKPNEKKPFRIYKEGKVVEYNVPYGNSYLRFSELHYAPYQYPSFPELRKKGYHLPTLNEFSYLLVEGCKRGDYEIFTPLTLSNWGGYRLNTCIYHTKKGIFVQDNPPIVNGKEDINLECLVKSLSNGYEEEDVFFSEDSNIRFLPNRYKNKRKKVILAIAKTKEARKNLNKSIKYALRNFNYTWRNHEALIKKVRTRILEYNKLNTCYWADLFFSVTGDLCIGFMDSEALVSHFFEILDKR